MVANTPSAQLLTTVGSLQNNQFWTAAPSAHGRQFMLMNKGLSSSSKLSEMSAGLECLVKALKKDKANLDQVDAQTKELAFKKVVVRVNNMRAKINRQPFFKKLFIELFYLDRFDDAFYDFEKVLYNKKYLSRIGSVFCPPTTLFGKSIQQPKDIRLIPRILGVQKNYEELRTKLANAPTPADFWSDDQNVQELQTLMEDCLSLSERFLGDEFWTYLLIWVSQQYIKNKTLTASGFDLINSKDTYLHFAAPLIPQLYQLVRFSVISYLPQPLMQPKFPNSIPDDYAQLFFTNGTAHSRCREIYNDYCKRLRSKIDQCPPFPGSFWEAITTEDKPGSKLQQNAALFKVDLTVNTY